MLPCVLKTGANIHKIYTPANFLIKKSFRLSIGSFLYTSSSSIIKIKNYVHFDDDDRLYCSTVTKSTLKTKYTGGVIDEYAVNKSHNYKYDSSTSTYKYEVYRVKKTRARTSPPYCDIYGNWLPGYPDGYTYVAFSNDRTEMIKWYTNENDDTPRNKQYYKLVKIEDLVPPSNPANYDFLR